MDSASPPTVISTPSATGSVTPKLKEEFRNYENSSRHAQVSNHYMMMRKHQTVEFAERMAKKYSFDTPRATMTIREAFEVLKGYVDASDPDTELPNMLHMLQTAEGIRKAGHPEWMQVVGLVHDMGKILFLWGGEEDGQNGTADGQQWSLGGDTWIVGCAIPDCVVFPEFNSLNPDCSNELYNTPNGIYQPNCGLDALVCAYGHDEYMYQMLVANQVPIPPEGLAMIRYHSCYAWHTGGAYRQFMVEKDYEMLKWVLEFNKYDLYTKTFDDADELDLDALWAYYDGLLAKMNMNGPLKW